MLTKLALRARIITLVIMAAVMAAGVYGITRLQLELMPSIDLPVVTISTFDPQASPQQVLDGVTTPIEQAVRGVPNVVSVSSTSAPSISMVVVQADFGDDMKAMEKAIKDRVAALKLPAGATPRIARVNPDAFPILEINATGGNDVAALAGIVNTQVLPAIGQVPGVASAETPLGIDTGVAISHINGQVSVPISILKTSDANTVKVSNAVIAKLDEIKPTLPAGVRFVEVSNQAPGIEGSIHELEQEVGLGAVLAIAIIFVFLLSVRPTLVTAISIPVSVLAALAVMHLLNMTLNILTLGGLAIAVGRVVDDSIVVMENTFRHIQLGEKPSEAALHATREVAVPITTSTLTTVAVFAPLAIIGGFISVVFVPFALTITFALVASLIVALTVVPVLASLFIRTTRQRGESVLQRTYTRMLRAALAHRGRMLLIAGGLIILSIALFPLIPISFFPSSGQSNLAAQMVASGVPSRDATLAQMAEVEKTLDQKRASGVIADYTSTYGGTGTFGGGARADTARFSIGLPDDSDATALATSLGRDLSGPGRTVSVSAASGMGPESNTLQVVLTGRDYPVLADTADKVTAAIAKLDGVQDVRNNTISGAAAGAAALPITRIDGEQAVTISGAITAKNTQRVQANVQRAVSEVGLPSGVKMSTGGTFAEMNRMFREMGIAMVVGVLLVYVVMALAQRSFVTPFIIVLSVPLAAIGALGSLAITQRSLGATSLIGTLMLVGLVVTNAIVLIAFVDQLRARGMPLSEALVQGARTRLRPILMTALTTIFVLLPLALGFGGENAGLIGADLATVVIGGLFTSTFLTLLVTPVIYSYWRKKDPKGMKPAASPQPALAAEPLRIP